MVETWAFVVWLLVTSDRLEVRRELRVYEDPVSCAAAYARAVDQINKEGSGVTRGVLVVRVQPCERSK